MAIDETTAAPDRGLAHEQVLGLDPGDLRAGARIVVLENRRASARVWRGFQAKAIKMAGAAFAFILVATNVVMFAVGDGSAALAIAGLGPPATVIAVVVSLIPRTSPFAEGKPTSDEAAALVGYLRVDLEGDFVLTTRGRDARDAYLSAETAP